MSLNRILLLYACVGITLVAIGLFLHTNVQNKDYQELVSKMVALEENIKTIPHSSQSDSLAAEIKALTTPKIETESSQSAALDTPESVPVKIGSIKVSDPKWKDATVNVYKDKSYSSQVLGKIVFGKTYHYLQKTDDWYQVSLIEDGAMGWVSSRFFEEIKTGL